ncbi:MAG: LacI family DNA-binding transcriptional regulator [Bacteroidota bacterium]
MTIYDIAKELNISGSTVSRALNNNPRISKKTRDLIQETAERLGYKPNQVALALRKGNSKTIGVIIPFVDRAFFGAVISGIEEVLKASGNQIMVCQSHDMHENEVENVNTLLGAQVSGILISVAPGEDYTHLEKVIQADIPLVMFDRVHSKVPTSSVKVDDFKGAYMATEHLIEQGLSKIVHFHGDRNLQIYEDRYQGYKQALKDYKMEYDPKRVYGGDCFIEIGEKLTDELVSSGTDFDAIFASSDYKAIGTVKRLKVLGFSVPDDIKVIGFGNEPLTELLEPSMSSVDQKPKEMGVQTAKSLLELMEAKSDVRPIKTTILNPLLISRESSSKEVAYRLNQ